MIDKRRTAAACVTVRSAAGLMPHFQRPFLKFVYEKPSTHKRVSAKTDEADAQRLDGTDTAVAAWRDAIVCVPVLAQSLSIELWNAHAQHDVYLGHARIHLDTDGPPEVGPMWVAVNQAVYEGVHIKRPVNLQVIVTYMDSSAVFPSQAPPSTSELHSVVHPSFQFKIPAREIDWSTIAATNVSEIFFLGNVEALLAHQDDVLYGNTLASLDMVVDKEFEAAFQMCQYSAQYLHQCVEFLSQRCATYVSSRDELLQRQDNSTHTLDAKKRQKRQLEKQVNECDVLIAAYEAIAKTLPDIPSALPSSVLIPTPSNHPPPTPREAQIKMEPPPASSHRPSDTTIPTDAAAPSSSSSPSKAPMLMTYEECMEKNRLAKEATRKDRIAAEKHRLTQIMADQAKQREWKQTLVEQDQALVHRSACRLQTWLCHVTFLRRYAVKRSQYAAAVVIQCLVRTRQARRMYRRRTDERRQRNKAQAIHAAEQILERQMHVATAKLQHDKEMEPILRLWTDIQQAIQRASSKESNVFSFFDRRHAGQVDRAVLRRQLLQLGFDVPRQVVRRLIQLIHSRANVQSDRLVVTADQFTKAFDLTTCIAIPPDVVAEVPPPPWTSANASPESNAVLEMTEASPALAPAVPTINSVEGISMTFRQLRERIVHAARVQFGGGECSSVSFASLRAALVKLFEWFDQHGSGDVALADFKACLETHLHVAMDAANWEYVRECFDADGSGSVNIAEFVAFAFADASVDEMGVLGYQLRDAILHRVKAARKDAAPTIEDAVRLVFHPVFHRRDDATFADFCHALAQLQLGFTLGQLSRLVLRLDHDKNHLISLDELLGWLKLKRSNDTRADTTHDEPPRPNTEPGVSAASAAVKQLRRHLVELAGEAKPHAIKHLFESIDTNQSAKLSASELHAYLGDDTAPLSVVEAAVACMDARRLSVVSKADFISFCLDTTRAATDEEVGVVVEQCRTKLCDMCADAAGLRRWFGALAQHQGKVRTAEFKRALKAMVHLPEHELDGVVRRLDFDGSGWISDKEFRAWVHPVRDIEVLLTLVERHPAMQQMGAALFAAFDVDGNGVIGIDEFHAGLKRFHIDVNTDEAAALLAEFDVNADGVLSASELHAMAEAYNSDELDLAGPSTEAAAAGYDDDFEDS